MTTTRFRAAAALMFAFVASSCGGDGNGGPTFADSVSTADAQTYAGYAVSDVGQSIGQLNFGEGSIGLAAPALATRFAARNPLASRSLGGHVLQQSVQFPDWRTLSTNSAGLRASAAEGCTLTQSGFADGGGVVDVDLNGFPDDIYYKEECLTTDSLSNPDTTYTHYWVVEERVKQNFGALYGFDISIHYLEKYADEFGNFESQGQDGVEGLDIRSGSAVHAFTFKVTEALKFDTASAAYVQGANWNTSFDPTGSIVLGDPLPDGALTLSGREYLTDTEDQNLSFSLSTTTPLAYDASCFAGASNPPFTAGVLIGRLNNNANNGSFTATFTACGVAPTVSTDGTFASKPIAAR